VYPSRRTIRRALDNQKQHLPLQFTATLKGCWAV